jgi:putative nucleotidyltransferase with HDIG domain
MKIYEDINTTYGARELIDSFTELKTIPQVAIKILNLLANDRSTIHDFEEVIRFDPVLVTRLLKLVNSKMFNLKKKVNSISHSVVFIGMKNLRNLVVCDALRYIFRESEMESGFSKTSFWMHCVAVGICSQLIAKRMLSTNGEDAFLAGILHDLGIIIEDQARHVLFQRVLEEYRKGNGSFLECELRVLNTNHCLVGSYAAQRWNFSEEIREVILRHHGPFNGSTPLITLLDIVQVSHCLVEHIGYKEMQSVEEACNDNVLEHIRNYEDKYRLLVRELYCEMEKIKSVFEEF